MPIMDGPENEAADIDVRTAAHNAECGRATGGADKLAVRIRLAGGAKGMVRARIRDRWEKQWKLRGRPDRRNGLLIPIALTGDEDENVKRMTQSEREKHAKLMDVELLRTFRKGAPIFKFSDRKEFLEIDVTCLEPEEVARRTWEPVVRCYPGLSEDS
jgi:hypothetical protein